MISVEQRRANNRASYERHRTERIAATTAYAAEHKEERKTWLRTWLLETRFKMTQNQFAALLAEQGNSCAICGTQTPGGRYNQWHIDHDHACCSGMESCGKCVRGILCAACNFMLGAIGDSQSTLLSAITYLQKGTVNG